MKRVFMAPGSKHDLAQPILKVRGSKGSRPVNWRVRMRRDELQLRRIVQSLARLQGETPGVAAARERTLRALAAKIAEMRGLVEDCLSGRTEYEQSVMEYRVRVEFPLYSHLGSLSALAAGHVDWFSA